jgi:ATP-dependent DNA helicase RecQ
VNDQGRPLQQLIVEAAMIGRHALAILPTGTGKSLCYQIPALSRYDKTGALTIVLSPLVALMADQVAGLEARGITCCAALTGLLSMPERADVLDRVRMGDVGILLVSPEQLRGRGFRSAIAQREIGAWVLDEAHCLSKWGHDFRPDYRYVGRFIREKAGTNPVPPVLCLTATANPDERFIPFSARCVAWMRRSVS